MCEIRRHALEHKPPVNYASVEPVTGRAVVLLLFTLLHLAPNKHSIVGMQEASGLFPDRQQTDGLFQFFCGWSPSQLRRTQRGPHLRASAQLI